MKSLELNNTELEKLNLDELNQINGGGILYAIGYVVGTFAAAYEEMICDHPEYAAMTRCYTH
ncbi:MAG TPA: hypothetical protein VE912_07205 [Bacteroidales bacterium]|nr:hypothetical protein [Bacteroidales bacterium]